jgi:predicted ABC-type transport system involved in lysophospholipase L1 biosynthesis ATPase subunit
VLVTHDPVVARQASRVLTMRDGQLVTDGGQKLASEGP